MPVGIKMKTMRGPYEGRGNEHILRLGQEACDATAAVHDAPPEEKARLLARAYDLRSSELDAWNRLPDKDPVGESMCTNGLGNICLLRHQLDPSDPSNTTADALDYYKRAIAVLDGLTDEESNKQRALVQENLTRLLLFESTHLLHKTVRVHGLVLATMYNGRIGHVQRMRAPGKYEVKLQPTADAPACELIVKQRNLELFGPQAELPREGAMEL
jgi:hypothetical protein